MAWTFSVADDIKMTAVFISRARSQSFRVSTIMMLHLHLTASVIIR